jgi:hypothetical protein
MGDGAVREIDQTLHGAEALGQVEDVEVLQKLLRLLQLALCVVCGVVVYTTRRG